VTGDPIQCGLRRSGRSRRYVDGCVRYRGKREPGREADDASSEPSSHVTLEFAYDDVPGIRPASGGGQGNRDAVACLEVEQRTWTLDERQRQPEGNLP
jgi:hypothetical protein